MPTRSTKAAPILVTLGLLALVPAATAQDQDAFAAALARAVEELAAAGEGFLGLLPPEARAQASACMAVALADLPPEQKQAAIDYEDAGGMMEALQESTRGTPAFDAVDACFSAAAEAAGVDD